MNTKRMILAFLLALSISGAMTWTLSKRLAKPVSVVAPKLQNIVVARRSLKIGERLSGSDIKFIELALPYHLPGTFGNAQEVLGHVLAMPLLTGEPLLEQHLALSGVKSGLAARIPDGMRAASFRIDDAGIVAGFMQPGSFVDIFTAYRSENGASYTSSAVLQNVQVLAIGQQLEPNTDAKPNASDSVTLLVTPEEAREVNLALARGKLSFAMRNGADTGVTKLVGESPDSTATVAHEISKTLHRVQPTDTTMSKQQTQQPNSFTVETIAGSKSLKQNFEVEKP